MYADFYRILKRWTPFIVTLPKCVMFGELVGGTLSGGVRKEDRRGVFSMASDLAVSMPTSKRLQPRTRENGAKRRNRRGGRFFMVKWIALLQKKLGPDYHTQ